MEARVMKRALAVVVALASFALVPSTPVSAAVTHVVGDALVRVAHFSPDTAGVDVWVDGKRVLQNVSYDTVSDYVNLPAGTHQFALRPFGASATSKPVLSATAALSPNVAYTIAGVGLNKDLRGQIFQDNLGAPPAGSAKIRVIDAAVGAAPINVVLPGGATFDKVGFAAASAYEAVAPSTYGVHIAGGGNASLNVPSVVVAAGIIYSFAVIGGAGKPLQLVPVVDARGPAVDPVGPAGTGGGGTARIRVHPVHG
jgi:Domain of unknown function (DUF4397)